MPREGHRHVVPIAEARVGACGEDDVHALEFCRQQALVPELLQVGLQNDLVHALGDHSSMIG
jgi:hypothetical protein